MKCFPVPGSSRAAAWGVACAILWVTACAAQAPTPPAPPPSSSPQGALAVAIRRFDAVPGLPTARKPPERADGRALWIPGVLLERDGETWLAGTSGVLWAYRMSPGTQSHLVGLRPGDLIAVVGRFAAVAPMRDPFGRSLPTLVLDALFVTNDGSEIPGDE